MPEAREEILFQEWSESWSSNMPTTLLYYDEGIMDLHCQTGDHHAKSIRRARRELWGRNLALGECEFEGPTGMYYPVRKIVVDDNE